VRSTRRRRAMHGQMRRLSFLLLGCACATAAPKPAPPVQRDLSELVTLEGDKIVVRESITFEHAKVDIAAQSTALLDAVAKILGDNPSIKRLTIVGHADATGDPANNPPLSLARASAVKRYLEGRGVDAARLEAQGVGADMPIDTNETDEGRARNRRVEFRVSR
jgi:OmpA-OmpF porin, OOP family